MKLKGDYSIDESGRYTVIFEDDSDVEWEVEFDIWIGKDYNCEETGRQLIGVDVQANCISDGFRIRTKALMEIVLEDHITNSFNL